MSQSHQSQFTEWTKYPGYNIYYFTAYNFQAILPNASPSRPRVQLNFQQKSTGTNQKVEFRKSSLKLEKGLKTRKCIFVLEKKKREGGTNFFCYLSDLQDAVYAINNADFVVSILLIHLLEHCYILFLCKKGLALSLIISIFIIFILSYCSYTRNNECYNL